MTTPEAIPSVDHQIKTLALHPDWYISLSSVLLAITTVAIILRGHVRVIMLRSFASDDAALLLAYAVFVCLATTFIAVGVQQRSYGVIAPFEQQIRLVLAAEMIYILQSICLKVALAAFFLRLVRTRWQRWFLVSSVVIFSLYMMSFAMVAIFQCGNPRNLVHYDEHKCIPWHSVLGPLNYIAAALNAIVDWIMTLTPLLVVLDLQMNKRDKLSVCFLILLGTLGSVVSVVRIPLVWGLKVIADLRFFHNILPISFCSIVEAALGTTALSLAALRPLFRHPQERKGSGREMSDSASGGAGLRTVGSSNGTASKDAAEIFELSSPGSQSCAPSYAPSVDRARHGHGPEHNHSRADSNYDAPAHPHAHQPSHGHDHNHEHDHSHIPDQPSQVPLDSHDNIHAQDTEDDAADDTTSKSELVDFPTSMYSSGRRLGRVRADEEWLGAALTGMGRIRLDTETSVTFTRVEAGSAAAVAAAAVRNRVILAHDDDDDGYGDDDDQRKRGDGNGKVGQLSLFGMLYSALSRRICVS